MIRLAALALLVLAVPASAQTAAEADARGGTEGADPTPLTQNETPPPVDMELVGAWTLAEVEDAGPFPRFDARIDDMAFAFTADGAGTATATIFQDGASYVRESTFSFGCADGAIVSDDHPTIHYEMLADGHLRLTDASGLAVRLARDEDTTALR